MGKDYFKYRNEISVKTEMENAVSAIYPKIMDETSKEIFVNCLMYSITHSVEFLRKNILLTDVGIEFDKMLNLLGKKSIYVYGAGERGKRLVEMFPEKNWGGYIDKTLSGIYEGYPILSSEEIENIRENPIIISVLNGWQEIKNDLVSKGVSGPLIALEEWNTKIRCEQYVEERCLARRQFEGGLVDAGSFDGLDVERISKRFLGENFVAWVFEPDYTQMQICKKNLENFSSIRYYQNGITDQAERNYISISAGGMTHITKNGEETVELVSLDEILANERIGFIKMDIEGFEEKALRGAEKIIRQQKPVVTVSV